MPLTRRDRLSEEANDQVDLVVAGLIRRGALLAGIVLLPSWGQDETN